MSFSRKCSNASQAKRLYDTANITWAAIDLPGKLPTCRAQKTKRLVTIPLHTALESRLLEMRAPYSGKAFVFPKFAGITTGIALKSV